MWDSLQCSADWRARRWQPRIFWRQTFAPASSARISHQLSALTNSNLSRAPLRFRSHAQKHVHQGKNHRPDKSRAEGVHMEARHQPRREHQHKGVDDQQEQSKRKDTEREGEDLQQQTKRRVQQADDQYRDECRDPVADVEARDEISDHKERDRTDDPAQQQSKHEHLSPGSGEAYVSMNTALRTFAAILL